MLLVVTITASAVDAEVSVQGARSEITSSPNDYTDQLQPALAISAAVTKQSGILGVLDGFKRLADLAAEVHCIVWYTFQMVQLTGLELLI